jgi:hypothetical protein
VNAVGSTTVDRQPPTEPTAGRASRAGRAAVGWFVTPMPLARIAVLRAIVYAFVIIDVFKFVADVIPHSRVPDLYQPTFLARFLQIPPLSVEAAYILLAVIILSCLAGIWGRYPRAAGWTVFASFWLWMLNSQGFSYVQHDHMALMVATLVLPTVGAAGYRDHRSSEAAGWALRCIQIAVVATYFGSAICKWSRSGSLIRWANASIFTWAVMRRGTDLVRWTLDYPLVLRLSQWGILTLEILSPIVFFLKGKRLYFAIATFLGFHLMTYLGIRIHFLPTVICWAAFLPLEQLPAMLSRRKPAQQAS